MMEKLGFILIALIFMMSSCQQNGSESAARALITELVAKNSEGYLSVVNMVKSDGVEETRNGVQVHTLKFQVEVECAKDGGWIPYDPTGINDGGFSSDFVITKGRFERFNTETKVGDRYKTYYQITVEKHENAWIKGRSLSY